MPPLIVLATEKFLSTPSARRATGGFRRWPTDLQISIHALREEGDQPGAASGLPGQDISIHALREEGDSNAIPQPFRVHAISIHALREEGDAVAQPVQGLHLLFLSTPSARRATTLQSTIKAYVEEFLSTPSARRATRKGKGCAHAGCISIHALREEGDGRRSGHPGQGQGISIHALREEGDVVAIRSDNGILRKRFLSTPSARRATDLSHHCPPCSKYFYPRPPRGGRLYTADFLCMDVNFYPRPPRGGRPHGRGCPRRAGRISIHALREEGDEQETSNETPT